jgi:hypothetical protein
VYPRLLRRTRACAKGMNELLELPSLPDVGMGETVLDVVAARLNAAFADVVPDAATIIADFCRVTEIYNYLQAGGLEAAKERARLHASTEYWEEMLEQMRSRGWGNVALVEAKVPGMREAGQHLLARLEGFAPEEEAAVARCKVEIDTVIHDHMARKREGSMGS